MAFGPVNGLPGVRTAVDAGFRRIRTSDQGKRLLPGGVVIDGSKSRDPTNTGNIQYLQAGLVIGRITTGGKYAPAIIGLTGVLHDTSAVTTTMTLPASVVTEIQRRIGTSGSFKIIGPPTANGTVATETVTFSAIASSTTITITATSADFAAGSIIAPADGSETPVGLIDDGDPIKVTDDDDSDIDVPLNRLLVGGMIDSSQIVNWSSDTSVQSYLKGKLNATSSSAFTFDDPYVD